MTYDYTIPDNWLPQGKMAAVCFTIDDIHPGKSTDHFEAGGDLHDGALGLVADLLDEFPELIVTLFTTANWRETTPVPAYKLLAAIPYLRDFFYLSKRLEKDSMNLINHPEFISYLNDNERFECAFHGLYHIHKGLRIPVEFQNQSSNEFKGMLREMMRIFNGSGLKFSTGVCPPGWNAPENLLRVLKQQGFDYIASSRDILSPITSDQTGEMSGLKGLPLMKPCVLPFDGLLHFPTNFQATSTYDRAKAIIDNGGLLSIKAHIVKEVDGYVALDGVDTAYMNYLSEILAKLKSEYGDIIWWTSMGKMCEKINGTYVTE